MQSDKNILMAIATQNKDAFSELYERYSDSVLKRLCSRIGDLYVAEDLFQEFWLFIWNSPLVVRVDENENAAKSLYYILSKHILDYYRTSQKVLLSRNSVDDSSEIKELHYSHVSEDIIEKDIALLIDQLVAAMPDLDRHIFNLRVRKQYSIKETAKMLKISEKTVQNRMTGIRGEIKSQLTGLSLVVSAEAIAKLLHYLDRL